MSPAAPPIHGGAVAAVVELLDRERLMTVACNRPDGWPQATTVGYLNEGLNLYFVVARTSQKFANLQADPRASVAIRSPGGSRGDAVGVSMAGRVVEVVDPAAVERLNRRIIERYPDLHAYCPSGDSVAVLHFRPSIVSPVGVTRGRSDAETFTIGDVEPGGVSQLF
ncbi:pyridoxamine 5'-phosphate oxidase family protein [Brevundimonas sp.]|uniref:pyridoxamine 5'-phosphate oxidase family protein n=1 Tax=Brevundimonas sp. TaxID=1871086 RepID=UPI002ED911B1